MYRIKVLWLCPYPVSDLQTEIQVDRIKTAHTSSWIKVLSEALSKHPAIDLHILTKSQYVNDIRIGEMNGITFHIIRDAIPFTNSGYPDIFPFDRLSRYSLFIKKAKKHIFSVIRPDLVHAHGTEGPYGLLAIKLGITNIISIQGLLGEILKFESSRWRRIKQGLEKEVLTKAENFGCRTHFDTAYVKNYNPKATIYKLPEAMNDVFFSKQWKGSESNVITFTGTICQRKGVFDLLIALKDVEFDFFLKIIGSGSDSDLIKLKTLIERNGLSHKVKLLGFLSAEAIAEILVDTAVFVLPSYIENSPNSIAEAQAVGTPVVAYDVGGISSMIQSNKTGILTEPRNILSLRLAITEVMKNKEVRLKLSLASKNHALKNYKAEKVVEQTIKVYAELLSLKELANQSITEIN